MGWARGTSGNPKGMAPGTICKSTRLRNLIGERVTAIIDKLIEAALNGDMAAAKILLDRALPPLRPVSMPINIDIPDGASLAGIGQSIIQSIAQGEISVEAGAQLMSSLTRQAKLIEVTELERRIGKLEEMSKTEER